MVWGACFCMMASIFQANYQDPQQRWPCLQLGQQEDARKSKLHLCEGLWSLFSSH